LELLEDWVFLRITLVARDCRDDCCFIHDHLPSLCGDLNYRPAITPTYVITVE
jgi:hypothetical protein